MSAFLGWLLDFEGGEGGMVSWEDSDPEEF